MSRIPARSPWSEPAVEIVPSAASLPDAACQREGAPDADEWFQAEGESTAAWTLRQQQLVRWHCGSCPVLRQCRRGAVERGEKFGVWGGLTETELRQVQLVAKQRLAGVAA